MLGATTNLRVATGIASIWARDAMTTANAAKTLNEAYDGRFLLGLGASHHTLTEWVRKHDYSKPLTTMRTYLERMDASMFKGVEPAEPTTVVLAALGPVYVGLPNYANNLLRLGFSENEITNLDDRLVDAIVAWGTVDDVAERVRAHHDAGASHVCIQVLRPDREMPTAEWRELADALL